MKASGWLERGWSAASFTDLAEGFRKARYGITIKPKEYAYWRTVQIAAERLYDAQEP